MNRKYDMQPDSDDEAAILQRLLAMTAKSAEQDSGTDAKRAAVSNAASMSSASSQTGGNPIYFL